MYARISLLAILLFSLTCLAGCADDDAQKTQDVTIAWEAILGDQAFQSGVCVDGIGSGGVAINVSDLRFYVSEVQAQNTAGAWVPLTLAPRPWQGEGVTLIDLADTETESGTAGMNNYLQGTLPQDDYHALRFIIGVPAALNHSNVQTANPPLNVGGMDWSWLSGRKFLRLDATPCGDDAETTDVRRISLHIGSTQCRGEDIAPEGCDYLNHATIEVAWSPGQNLRFDLDALFAESDLYHPTEDTASLCMSDPDDHPDCGPIFDALGIPFGAKEGDQSVFTSIDAHIAPVASGEAAHGNNGDHDAHHDHH